jgi:uncharacterized protein (DUF2141 family)
MKIILTILVCFMLVSLSAQKKTYNLTVIITNLKNANGSVEVGLYRNGENFAKVGLTYKKIRTTITQNQVTVVFYGLEENKYGVCVYHDENNNNACDRNFFGFPTEPYGFSNNMRPVFSVPSFESCAIKLDKNKTISIKNTL